ncbi:hypothetical protein ACHAP5_007061 [Fusarium lateritium]
MGFTETLLQRTDRAYMHLQGALAISAARFKEKPKVLGDEDDISNLLQKLSLHTATWRMSAEPVSAAPDSANSPSTTMSPDRALYRKLTVCYHFISTALPFKYAHVMQVPSDLIIEQSRHIADLQQWLAHHQLDTTYPKGHSRDEQLLVLRLQCLTALINVSNVLNPYEMAYDMHSPELQDIISSGEMVLDMRTRDNSSRLLPLFSPEMGIIQPLFLTGLKYRHSFWREKALNLLRRSGREGPWCGHRESRVLEAVINAEEGSAGNPFNIVDDPQPIIRYPDTITEDQRVHSCLVVDYLDRRLESVIRDQGTGSPARFAKIQLSKCLDLDTMLSDETRGPNRECWADQTHWCTWFETVTLPE